MNFLASAHGILAQARILGGSFGITISTACLHHFAINRLADILPANEFASFDGDVTHFKGDSLEAIRSAFIAAFNLSVVLADAASWIAYFSTLYGYRFTVKATERPLEEDILDLQAKVARARASIDKYRNAIPLANRST